MVAAIGGLARRGILVRGGACIEAAAKVDDVIFDKTGTVTEGRFEIIGIVAEDGSEDEVLALAAAAEGGSDHVLGAGDRRGSAAARPAYTPPARDARVLPGTRRGMPTRRASRARRQRSLSRRKRHSGSLRLAMERDRLYGATAVLVAAETAIAGAILLRDRVRQGACRQCDRSNSSTSRLQVMLTGDRRRAAEAIAREIRHCARGGGVAPGAKARTGPAAHVAQGRNVAMVGDGINDAPALWLPRTSASQSPAPATSPPKRPTSSICGHSLEKLPSCSR